MKKMSEKIFLLTTSNDKKYSSTDFNKLKEYAEQLLSSEIFKYKTTTGPSSFFTIEQYSTEEDEFCAEIIETRKNTFLSQDQSVFSLNIERVKVIV